MVNVPHFSPEPAQFGSALRASAQRRNHVSVFKSNAHLTVTRALEAQPKSLALTTSE